MIRTDACIGQAPKIELFNSGGCFMNPTVSIIVPVYNAESCLSRCVDSILGQEYPDFEVLLADDGSTDRSGSICDAYAASDSRVRVIHKPNTGVSDTRNAAISQARGTYLQFLDSDDWITPDATKLFVRAMEDTQCDMVIADFYRVVGGRVSHKGDIDDSSVLSREEFAGHMMKNPADFYYGVIWNKLYRRDIIEKHHLRMNTELDWCEDFLFNLEYILHAETFYALKAPVYYYVKTKGSLVSQSATIVNSVRMKLTVFEYYNRFYKHVLDEKDYEKNRFQVYRFLIDAAKDGTVPPAILPGATKLGRERTSICPEAVTGEGILASFYRSRKLLDRYLEIAALKHGLSLDEIRMLMFLDHARQIRTKKDLADFTGMTLHALTLMLQKLEAKKLIKAAERPAEKKAKSGSSSRSSGKILDIVFLPDSGPVLQDLQTVQNDFDQVRFSGLDDEELIQYAVLTEKIRQNIQETLL